MSLVAHARKELQMVGLFDKDSDYGGMLGEAVIELMEVFAKQGHSGFSAMQTVYLFKTLAGYKTLSPITSEASEWVDVSGMSDTPLWQNLRDGSYFSLDGGLHFYGLDETPKWKCKIKRWLCEHVWAK